MRVRSSRGDASFAKKVSSNNPEYIESPLKIFLYLFPHDLLDFIIHQTNLHLEQNQYIKNPFTKKIIIHLPVLGINSLI